MVLISFVSWKKHRNMKFCQVAIPDDAKLAICTICTYTCTCILRTLNNLQWQCIEGLVLHLVIVCNNDLYKSSINGNLCVECSVHSLISNMLIFCFHCKENHSCITILLKFLLCI